MNIGETIKKLRRDKDMTQEQLAEYLNITTQAVSKWETGQSLPDITLVPMLCNIFDTSADVLLGVDIDAKEKKIQEIITKGLSRQSAGYSFEAITIFKDGLNNYPNNYMLMSALMSSTWLALNEIIDDTKLKEMTSEVIRLGEKILSESTNDDLRHNAIQILCYTYPNVGDTEKAITLAEKMPFSSLARENLLEVIYTGTKKFEQKRINLLNTIHSMHLDLTCNINPLDDGCSPYTTDELITINKKYINVLNIFFDNGVFGMFYQTMAWTYLEIAKLYARQSDYKQSVENLKIAADHSIKSDTDNDPDNEYTCLLFRGMKYGGVSHNNQSNDSLHQLEQMKNPVFDPIRERADFIEIEEELKKHAKKH